MNREIDYGYGEAIPDSGSEYNYLDLGYGDAAPDIASDPIKNNGSPSFAKSQRRSSLKTSGAPRRSSISYSGEIEVSLPGERKVRRRTSISFDDIEQVKEVDPVASLTDDPEKLWFQAEEYDLIRQKASILTRVAATGGANLMKSKNLCVRGLESHIDSQNVQEEQYIAWKCVFLEQHIQRGTGQFDDETVSQMYSLASMENKSRAQKRAWQDKKDIEKYTRSNRMMLRRSSM